MTIADATEAPPVVIQTSGLSRTFPPAVPALKDATLTIRRGESIAIVGRSGSGKTTLLSLLGLLDTPSSGRYHLLGTDVSAISDATRTTLRREHLGFVFQAFHLIPHLTARENVEHALQISGLSHARDRAARALAEVGLHDRADSYPPVLSGGEQQRIAIARALAKSPPIILCDEPTGNLDSRNTTHVLALLLDRRPPTTTTVIVTHDAEVARACDRIIDVKDGVTSEGAA